MKRQKMHCLWLAAMMALAMLAGCAPSPQGQQPPKEPLPEDAPILETVTGQISPEQIAIRQGENTLTISSQSVFPADVEEHLDGVVVNYGWGDCNPKRILRKDDHTLEVTFLAEPASDPLVQESRDSGYMMVAGEDTGGHNPVCATFSIVAPKLSIQQAAAKDASRLTLDVALENAELAQELKPEHVQLSKAFSTMKVTAIERKSDNGLSVILEGSMAEEDDGGFLYLEGGITLLPDATSAAASAYGEAPLVTPAAYLQMQPAFGEGNGLTVGVMVENCHWKDVSPDQITLSGAFEQAKVKAIDRARGDILNITLDINREDCTGIGSIVFAPAATDAGQALGVDVDFAHMGFFADLEAIEEKDGRVTLRINAVPVGLTLTDTLLPEDLTLAGEFEQGKVDAVSQKENGPLEIAISFSAGQFAELDGYGGHILLPLSSVTSKYASMDDFDAVIFVGRFKENMESQTPLAAQPAQEENLLLSAGSDKLLINDTTGSAFTEKLTGFVADSLVSMAKAGLGKVGGVLSGKLMEWLGWTEDKTGKKLDEIISRMDSLTEEIDKIERNIDKLIDAVETSAFKEQMRDVQNSVLKLKPRVSGYQAALGELGKLEPGSQAYKEELEIFADMVNNAKGIDFHSETYGLGEKLLSDAAGTADGAIKAHYDRIIGQNNWESQTYDERERFYLYSVGTYMQAAMLDSIGLAYTVETSKSAVEKSQAQRSLNELKTQVGKVAQVAKKYQVKRLKPAYDRNLRTGVILKTNVESAVYDGNNRLVSQGEAYRLIKQKLIDDTKPGKYTMIIGSGNFTLPEYAGLLSEKQAGDMMKYSRKGSLLEELKDAGFAVPKSCPNAVILRDIFVDKNLIRTGTSPTRYHFSVYYKLYQKAAANTYAYYMVTLSDKRTEIPENTDYSRCSKYREGSWETQTIQAAVVTVVQESESLYIAG